ncbi:unnamed protein product [Coccothraustes coccothraustes]
MAGGTEQSPSTCPAPGPALGTGTGWHGCSCPAEGPAAHPGLKKGAGKTHSPSHLPGAVFPATLLVPMSPSSGTQWLFRMSSQNSNQGCGELTLIKALVF